MTDYKINDRNGETRIQGPIVPDPAFNGGTITQPLTVEPTSPTVNALTLSGPVGSNASDFDALLALDEDGNGTIALAYSGDSEFAIDSGLGYSFRVISQNPNTGARTGNLFFILPDSSVAHLGVPGADAAGEVRLLDWAGNRVVIVGNGNKLGFYGHASTAQQTGVPVTIAAVHAALVTLGLITA